MIYKYGMRARGFAPWCQPMKAIVMAKKDESGKYHNILFYSEPLIMNEKQEKKRRYNLRLEFIAHFNKWLDSEPPRWRFIRWRKWKNRRPVWEDYENAID